MLLRFFSFLVNYFYWFFMIISHLTFELINPNLHCKDSHLKFQTSQRCNSVLLMMPGIPPKPTKNSIFLLFSIVVLLKRKINSSLTEKQTMCNFDISSEGWTWSIFCIKYFLGKEPRVALSLLQTIMTFGFLLFHTTSWWILIRPIHDMRVRKSHQDNL